MSHPTATAPHRRPRRTLSQAITLTGVMALTLALGGLSGCATPPADQASEHRPNGQPGQSFASEQEMLDWLAAQAEGLPSARIVRDKDGRVIGVDVESPEDRAALAAALGGPDGYFLVGGESVSVAFLQPPGSEGRVVEKGTEVPLCGGSLCTLNKTWTDHYFFYHSVGASTVVTSGGYREWYYQPRTVYPPCPPGARVCPPPQLVCEPGDVLVNGNRAGMLCYHREGSHTASVDVAWFVGPNVSVHGSKVVQNGNASVEKTAFGINVKGPCPGDVVAGDPGVISQPAECAITGICAAHFAFAPGGSTMTTTQNGEIGVCPFR